MATTHGSSYVLLLPPLPAVKASRYSYVTLQYFLSMLTQADVVSILSRHHLSQICMARAQQRACGRRARRELG